MQIVMIEKNNPILAFRTTNVAALTSASFFSQGEQQKNTIGKSGNKSLQSRSYARSLITETRETIDTTEHA